VPIALDEIRRANEEIRPHVPRSRLLLAESLNRDGCSAYLKPESELPTGSFKIRGALYALKRALAEQSVSEVVASSTGNHGVGMAYAASLLKTRATIFLPEHANPLKRERIRRLGAVVRETGNGISEACLAAGPRAGPEPLKASRSLRQNWRWHLHRWALRCSRPPRHSSR
jgi:threonine dehydratase